MTEDINASDESQMTWNVQVRVYEAKKNCQDSSEVEGYEAPSSADGPRESVDQINQENTFQQAYIANFWPKE